jgi:RNA polymerase sigma-32 factor
MTQHALTLSELPQVGSIEQYTQSIAHIPFLTASEETHYGRQLRDDNDLEAAKKLIMSHLRLVAVIARQYQGYGLPQADLIQEGNIGLMKAVRRFDPERGVRLISFAVYWIKAEIHEYVIKNWRLVKIATTKAQRKLFFGLRAHKTSLNSLSIQETADIAKQMGVRPEDVQQMEIRLSGQDVSINLSSEESESTGVTNPALWLTDQQHGPLEQLQALQEDRLAHEGLIQALGILDDRSRQIIESRWLSGDQEPKTLHDLADQFGVSAERIRQIESRAMQKLKQAILAEA